MVSRSILGKTGVTIRVTVTYAPIPPDSPCRFQPLDIKIDPEQPMAVHVPGGFETCMLI